MAQHAAAFALVVLMLVMMSAAQQQLCRPGGRGDTQPLVTPTSDAACSCMHSRSGLHFFPPAPLRRMRERARLRHGTLIPQFGESFCVGAWHTHPCTPIAWRPQASRLRSLCSPAYQPPPAS